MTDISKLKILQSHEMIEVQALPTHERRRLFISGYVDYKYQNIILFRGDGTSVVVAFDYFKKTNNITEPDFNDFNIIDYGHAIKLGEYEASTRSILIEVDLEYKGYCDSIRIIHN